MRKNALMNAAIIGMAGLASEFGNLVDSAGSAARSMSRFRHAIGELPTGTHRRNRTSTPSNRGIIARRKANKVARHNRVFNAQRARK